MTTIAGVRREGNSASSKDEGNMKDNINPIREQQPTFCDGPVSSAEFQNPYSLAVNNAFY